MNVAALMNDGPPPEKTQSPDAERQGGSQAPVGSNNRQPATPPIYAHQQSPARPPHLSGAPHRSQSQSQGLPPLQTGSQGPGDGQYHYYAQAAQSPAAATTPVQYGQPHESYPSISYGARPQTQSSLHSNPSPSHPPTGVPQSLYTRPLPSTSPTPPSHHSQTPHSVRQSPLSSASHIPPPQHHYQPHAHPSTPLGPPPLQYQRSATHAEMQSPLHQRKFSAGSNGGVVYGSPAQHHPSIGNIMESPGTYPRQSPQLRRQSEHPGQDREHSLSVSPKTTATPRAPSLGSRQSSAQDVYSSRSSLQSQMAPMVSPGHVTYPNPAGQVSQPTPVKSASNTLTGNPAAEDGSLSQPSNQLGHPGAIQHQSQKMGMNHLLTPANESPRALEVENPEYRRDLGSSGLGAAARSSHSPAVTELAHQSRPNHEHRIMSEDHSAPSKVKQTNAPAREPSASRAPPAQSVADDSATSQRNSPASLKRPASEQLAEPPAKQRRTTRKYTQRPPWAQLSRLNPQNQQAGQQNGSAAASRPQRPHPGHAQPQQQAPAQVNGMPKQQANNAGADGEGLEPWLQDPPLDGDLIHARQVLGKWEKSFKWNTPMPDLERYVQDWLFIELEKLNDVGTNPAQSAIEIEAKVGTLIQQESGLRCNLPVATATVIHPDAASRYNFESQMTEDEHQTMNQFLNGVIRGAQQKGRAHMSYKHTYETDSFAPLSSVGLSAVPDAIRRRMAARHSPSLRTTTDTNHPDKVLARIVKIPLSNLHIFNPGHPYDCRISLNLEVNLDRPDLHPANLVDMSTQKTAKHRRVKDRMAYKHLAYSIDLTKVARSGLSPIFELELEVDAEKLQQQIAALKAGRDHAYGDVVSGFLDNITFLMRLPKPERR